MSQPAEGHWFPVIGWNFWLNSLNTQTRPSKCDIFNGSSEFYILDWKLWKIYTSGLNCHHPLVLKGKGKSDTQYSILEMIFQCIPVFHIVEEEDWRWFLFVRLSFLLYVNKMRGNLGDKIQWSRSGIEPLSSQTNE